MSDEIEQSAKDLAKEERLKAAWDRWFEIDFSWQGLKTPAKVRAPWDDEDDEPSFDPKETDGDETLQTYWLKDPETGEARNEQQLIDADELIRFEGQKTYHIAHLPLAYADGTPTIKSTNREVVTKKLEAIIQARLKTASPSSDLSDTDLQEIYASRARLIGVVFLDCNLSRKGFSTRINAFLDEAIFSGYTNFDKAVFSGHTSFDNAMFSERVRFTSTEFTGNTSFTNATFVGHSRFDNARFLDYTEFYNARFFDFARFEKVSFSSYTWFNKVGFYDNAFFDNTVFAGHVSFEKTTFSGYASFEKVAFTAHANFDDIVLSGNVYFDNAAFSDVSFTNAKLSARVSFNNTKISSSVSFDNVTIFGDAAFYNATFGGSASFEGCIFKETVSLSGARFDGPVLFKKIGWPTGFKHRHRMFQGATFNQLVDLTGSGFNNFAAFDGARFEGGVRLDRTSDSDATSQFRRELNQILEYDGSDTKSVKLESNIRQSKVSTLHKKKLPGGDIQREREDFIQQFESGCRVLKLEMEKAADKNREQLLYRFELMARRAQDTTSRTEKFFSRAYELFSDYANSTARPLGWLLVTLVTFGLGAYALDGWLSLLSVTSPSVVIRTDKLPLIGTLIGPIGLSWPNLLHTRFDWDSLWSAMSFSLGNTVHPLSVLSSENLPEKSVAHRLLTQYGEGYGFLVRFFASMQSILSIVLVFLFALAVRRRFQIN